MLKLLNRKSEPCRPSVLLCFWLCCALSIGCDNTGQDSRHSTGYHGLTWEDFVDTPSDRYLEPADAKIWLADHSQPATTAFLSSESLFSPIIDFDDNLFFLKECTPLLQAERLPIHNDKIETSLQADLANCRDPEWMHFHGIHKLSLQQHASFSCEGLSRYGPELSVKRFFQLWNTGLLCNGNRIKLKWSQKLTKSRNIVSSEEENVEVEDSEYYWIRSDEKGGPCQGELQSKNLVAWTNCWSGFRERNEAKPTNRFFKAEFIEVREDTKKRFPVAGKLTGALNNWSGAFIFAESSSFYLNTPHFRFNHDSIHLTGHLD